MFIDESCITGPSCSVTKVDFVERFLAFLTASMYDTSLAGDGLVRAMRVKGYSQNPPDGRKSKMIKMLNSKERRGGFFGIRLRTDAEMEAEPAKEQEKPTKEDPCGA